MVMRILMAKFLVVAMAMTFALPSPSFAEGRGQHRHRAERPHVERQISLRERDVTRHRNHRRIGRDRFDHNDMRADRHGRRDWSHQARREWQVRDRSHRNRILIIGANRENDLSGTYAGSAYPYYEAGNGTYIYGDGYAGVDRSTRLAPVAKIIDLKKGGRRSACSFEAGVCVIRP